ncbi:MAG: cytochrome c1, partial [Pseudomonadota bacterium]|nr:cytochrome c1 [Pseudomonadota bacterium]
MNAIRTLLAAACVALLTTPVVAAGGGKEAPARQWAHSGLFGTFDRAALRRGARVYMEVCSACHGLRLVAYRNLMEIGFSENEVKKIAAEKEVPAEPNDEGEVE